jgi:hypothetical protein
VLHEQHVAIPGRIRVKVTRVKDNPALANELQRQLAQMRIVQQAAANPLTGSVLVTYDPHLLESLNSSDLVDAHMLESMREFLALAELLGIRPEGGDTLPLEDWFRAHSNGANPAAATTAAGAVQAFFGTLNTKVAQASRGWSDLKILLPLVLFFLGVRSMLLAEKVPFPAWYDYFWFAFGTFMALHPSTTAKT